MGCTNSNSVKVKELKRENNNVQIQNDNQIQNGLIINNNKTENKLNSENLNIKQNNLPKEEENPFKKENKEIPNKKMLEQKKEETFKEEIYKDKEKKEFENKNLEKEKNINHIENIPNGIKGNDNILKEIENLKSNGLNKINKNDFPKCNDALNLSTLEKYFIEKSENLNYIEKSFFIYNWITLNISLDLKLKNNNENNNLENIFT